MYSTKVLGPDTSSSLQYSMWIICTLHFDMRTGKETHDLIWADIQQKSDAEGKEYLVYSLERQTKTRTGMNPRDVRPTKPRAYAVPERNKKDPVTLCKQFQEHRPADMLEDDAPFLLTINYNHKPNQPWYKKTTMGINKLYQIRNELKTGWLVGCFGLSGPLRQYFSLYQAVSQREGERNEKR